MAGRNLIGLYLLVLAIIAITILFIWAIVRTRSRLEDARKVQNFWCKASEQLAAPHRCWFILCLIYGIGFNCIVRSFLYSMLQILTVLKINDSLGFFGEYMVSCVCTITSSFVVTAMYKIEGGSFSILYSVILALSVLPTGLLMLIDNYNEISVATWVIWPISIVLLSLLSSLAVFKFAKFMPLKLNDDSIEYSNVNSEVADPELRESEPEQDTRAKGSQAQQERNKATKQVFLVILVFFGYMFEVSVSGHVQRILEEEPERTYSSTLLTNLSQFMAFLACGTLIIFLQSQAVMSKLSLRNWGWLLLPVCFICYAFEYVGSTLYKIAQFSSDKEVYEFVSIEVFRTPFNYAAVGFICSAVYFIVCLKTARRMLTSVQASELASFESSEPQYA